MKQEFIHKEFMDNILSGPSISKHDKPKKLMIMLHGYGDNAANFIYLAEPLDQDEWGMHYVALNAPNIMPGNPMGYQWFDLYINGVYISDAGPKEYKIIDEVITANVTKINNPIDIELIKPPVITVIMVAVFFGLNFKILNLALPIFVPRRSPNGAISPPSNIRKTIKIHATVFHFLDTS